MPPVPQQVFVVGVPPISRSSGPSRPSPLSVNRYDQSYLYRRTGSKRVTALLERVTAIVPWPLMVPYQITQIRPSLPVAAPQTFACRPLTEETATDPPP